MKFFEDILCQEIKTGYRVCGDACLCERTEDGTAYVLCDGVGSGIYANIAAITCVNRLMELLRRGVSLRAACEMVAGSMHRARTENIPFSAFSALLILPDGKFTVYTYESPNAILIRDGSATILKPHFYTAGYEVIGEAIGTLDVGDSLILSSDGVPQAGIGHGYGLGIGEEGITNFINREPVTEENLHTLPRRVVEMCARICKGKYEDDTTLALLHCRTANQLTLMTGPPSRAALDREYVSRFMLAPGAKIVCGSTTADIVSRELGRDIEIVNLNIAGSPPEYRIEGIDLTTEGAIMLNQVYNILGEPTELFMENSLVERFAIMLTEADVVHLMIGNAMNDAHDSLLFKQVGVRVRKTTIKLIADKLREMGKLVIEKYY